MNPIWKDFLLSGHARFEAGGIEFPESETVAEKRMYALGHLGVLSVTGNDAATLLQGQITCNIHEVTEQKASLAAMCNPKGRVISTFLVCRQADGYLLVLPKVLLETVQKKLQMYVLRSKVSITDCSDSLCLIGLQETGTGRSLQFAGDSQGGAIHIAISPTQNRRLVIAEPDNAITLWSNAASLQNFRPVSSSAWRCLDIAAGIPWLNLETSEEYIPQMLNLDKLGGISFNKGCYTGQEVVARTHYLGKSKRALLVANCNTLAEPAANTPLFTDGEAQPDSAQSAGHILTAYCSKGNCIMQVVLQVSETGTYPIKLADGTPVTVLA